MDIKAWLMEQGVAAKAYNAERLLDDFLAEMKAGLAGASSSLSMIPSYMDVTKPVPANEPVAVIDAGGTHLRTGLVEFDETSGARFSNFTKRPMPGRDAEVEAAVFYQVLVDALERSADQFGRIGFCFSYPAEILPNRDGRLLAWTKEIKMPGLTGQCVGAGLLKALEARGIPGKQVTVLNDAVATLLAGRVQEPTMDASGYVGFILGTGTNMAYVERNANIAKVSASEGRQVVNVESGGFARFPRRAVDLEIDQRSGNPGRHVFEKAISGAYLGTMTLGLLQRLVREGVFSDRAAAELAAMRELDTPGVSLLAASQVEETGGMPGPAVFNENDRALIGEVFRHVVGRAALLSAVNIAAAVIIGGDGKDAERPVCVNVDGSTYYRTPQLAKQVQAHLAALLDKWGRHARCIYVEDAPVVGAAIAGLTA